MAQSLQYTNHIYIYIYINGLSHGFNCCKGKKFKMMIATDLPRYNVVKKYLPRLVMTILRHG